MAPTARTAPHVTGVFSGEQLSAPRIRRRGPHPADAGRGPAVQGPAVASSDAAVGDLLGYGDLPELLAIRGEHLDPGEGRRPQVPLGVHAEAVRKTRTHLHQRTTILRVPAFEHVVGMDRVPAGAGWVRVGAVRGVDRRVGGVEGALVRRGSEEQTAELQSRVHTV